MSIRCRAPCTDIEPVLDSSGNIIVYETKNESKRGAFNQLIEKAKIKEIRRKSPGREEGRDRQTRRSRKSPENMKPKTPSHSSTNKALSLCRTLKNAGLGNNASIDMIEQQLGDLEQHSMHQGI
jgi:hypothetical protein